MINDRRIRHGSAWAMVALAGLVLQGCSETKQPEAAAGGPRLYAADFQGAAKSCTVPKVSLTAGEPTDVAMTVGNDGGWCAISMAQPDGKPYDAGLLSQMPQHGKVLIHEVGDATRIDYTPDSGFAGSDTFMVTLIPGNPAIRAAVTVVQPGTVPAQTKR